VRVTFRTLLSLALCAAAAGAALAHVAIDIAGDYVLPADSYDHLQHGSRELLAGLAVVVAAVLAARGLRICCTVATANRGLIARPALGARDALLLFVAAVTASIVLVPAMECLDGRLDGVVVHTLADAFGGSIALGLITTLLCAGAITLLVYGVARWLVSHRDSIATMIETLLRRVTGTPRTPGQGRFIPRFAPRRGRAAHALRLAKRGPPAVASA
jgi:hypothetical protein